MSEFLDKLKTRVRVGVVGGSDLVKIKEQLGDDGETQNSQPKPRTILLLEGFYSEKLLEEVSNVTMSLFLFSLTAVLWPCAFQICISDLKQRWYASLSTETECK